MYIHIYIYIYIYIHIYIDIYIYIYIQGLEVLPHGRRVDHQRVLRARADAKGGAAPEEDGPEVQLAHAHRGHLGGLPIGLLTKL